MRLNRRRLLQVLTRIPVIGGILAILSPLLRYVKPNERPYELPLTQADAPTGGAQIVGKTASLAKPWDYFYFTYVQQFIQYDPARYEAENIPGVAIRLPGKVKFVNAQGYDGHLGETDIVLFSRICPHLGCIFNFIPSWHNVTTGYGGFVPPKWEQHPLMARFFRFGIRGEDIVVTGAEVGAIAYAAPEGPAEEEPGGSTG